MGGFLKSAMVGALAVLASTTVAMAADYHAPPIGYPPVEIGSGWYLRGDLGVKRYLQPNAHFDEAGYGDLIDETISDTGLVGLGFGYQWTRHFRTDVTLDYEWPGEFHGRLICPAACPSGTDPDYSDEYANISAATFLINGYWDIAKLGPLTPYVGAGIGLSYIRTSNVNYVNPAGVVPADGTWGGASRWNLAWALMAGASYELTRHWLFDANYRFLHLGDAASAGTTVGTGSPLRYDDLEAQEIRLGLRYRIY